jgi:hypothetical protein
MAMRKFWRDDLRHRFVSFVNGPHPKGRISIDDLTVLCRKNEGGTITVNLGHVMGDRSYLLAQIIEAITETEGFLSSGYQTIGITGFYPEELPLITQRGWVEDEAAPLVALRATKVINRTANTLR